MNEYTGPTITHQAIETLPHPYKPHEKMTRCWSKWTDGAVTHTDTVNTYHTTPDGFTLIGVMPINIGLDRDLAPPDGLKWIDTREIAEEMRNAR